MASAEQLQQALGIGVTIERELGGGGMSRVFLALDRALNRRIVIKVLPDDVAAGVGAERFRREIAVAAALQHANIVPVLQAAEADGVPFYTMPYVEGESLRAALARGPLPIGDVLSHVRDVARALAYAHERGVVHRDIKPDNILVSGGAAAVADFGIAKAISAARGGDAPGRTLTQVGTSIGTPTYMAPEQAAADPNTDHRADLYALGCVTYELLSGRPPFVASTPQKLLAAHMGEAPQRIADLRPDTPAALAEVVMRCLAKDADARPRSAMEIVRALETVTSGGEGRAAMPAVLLGGRGSVWRALGVWTAAFGATAILAKAAIVGIGLPDWVFPGAVGVAALGLPAILFTAWVQRTTHRVLTTTPVLTPGGTPTSVHGTLATIALKASPHVSLQRNLRLGMAAGGTFLLVVAGYMALRALGIGPAGSLLASGAIAENERVLVADIASPTGDATLGTAVTEALRTGLAQSDAITVLQQATLTDVLRRMEKPDSTPVDFAVAREIATREGVKVLVDGKLVKLGGQFILTLRLVSSRTGEELARFRETADDERDMLPMVDRITKDLRGKLGESLRSVQGAPPIEQVTTPSLDALKKYAEGLRRADRGDFEGGIALFEQAVAVDTAFAMAYRKMGVEYGNHGFATKAAEYAARAFRHRSRLSDPERLTVEISYYRNGLQADSAAARRAAEQLLDIQPKNRVAMNHLVLDHFGHRQFVPAESLLRRIREIDGWSAVTFINLVAAVAHNRGPRVADSVLTEYRRAVPDDPELPGWAAGIAWRAGRRDSAVAIVSNPSRRPVPLRCQPVRMWSPMILAARGRLREARPLVAGPCETLERRGQVGSVLTAAAGEASLRATVLEDRAGAAKLLDDAVKAHPPAALPATQHETLRSLAIAYASAGRADRARAMLALWDKAREQFANPDDMSRHWMLGQIALAEGKPAVALAEWQAGDVGRCSFCALPGIALAQDLLGRPDSAIAAMERYLADPDLVRVYYDQFYLAGIHKRLGELYESKGEKSKALSQYLAFTELWKKADPELQPMVAKVREAIKRVQDTEGSR
ncbi:MAG: protein kinase [Gemmatimonadetes bacterium]|nr:protein kinase [Gemmatimonadota bacterium]